MYGEDGSQLSVLYAVLRGIQERGVYILKDRKLIGKAGEDMAAALLYGEGYEILTRNFRSHFGEIDIVCEKEGKICFVEVKTRTSDAFGEPEESVNEIKQYRMKKTAVYFLMKNRAAIRKYLSCKVPDSFKEPDVMFKVVEIMIRETDDPLLGI